MARAKKIEAVETAEVVEAVETAPTFAVTCNVPNFYIGNHHIVDVVPNEVLEDERLNKILQNALRTGVIKKA